MPSAHLATPPALAKRCLYLDAIRDTQSAFQVSAIIEAHRSSQPTKPWMDIPL